MKSFQQIQKKMLGWAGREPQDKMEETQRETGPAGGLGENCCGVTRVDRCSAIYTLPQSLILTFPLTPSTGKLLSRWHKLLRVILKNKTVKRLRTN